MSARSWAVIALATGFAALGLTGCDSLVGWDGSYVLADAAVTDGTAGAEGGGHGDATTDAGNGGEGGGDATTDGPGDGAADAPGDGIV